MSKISLINKAAITNPSMSRQIVDTALITPEVILEYPWSPILTTSPYLKEANFESTSLLVLDIDGGMPLAAAVTQFAAYEHIIGTTKSHQVEKKGLTNDRYRVILFLKSRISNLDQYKFNYKAHVKALGLEGIADTVGDGARFYYPCVDIVSTNDSGKLLDVLELEKQAAAPAAIVPNIANAKLSKRTLSFLAGMPQTDSWHNATLRVIGELKDNGYDIDTVRSMVSRVGTQAWDNKDEYRLQDVFKRGKVYFKDYSDVNMRIRETLEKSILVINMVDSNEVLAVHKENFTKQPIDPKVLSIIFTKEGRDLMLQSAYTAKFTYNPMHGEVFYAEAGIPCFNTYEPPAYLANNFFQNAALPTVSKIPTLIQKFLMHLVDSDLPSYEFLLDWLHYCVTGRNLTVLTLIGTEGTGKGVLSELITNMVGSSNASKARANIFKGRFNNLLANKRFVLLDELEIKSSEEYALFKDLVNEHIVIEAKGKDEELRKNYASFMLASNNLRAIRPAADDRRFSLLNLTQVKLPVTFTDDEITALQNDLNLAENFALYLRTHVPKHKHNKPFKAESKADQIENANMTNWQDYLLYEFSVDYVDQDMSIEAVQNILKDKVDMYTKIGRRKLAEFCSKYPAYFKLIAKNNTRYLRVLTVPTNVVDLFEKEEETKSVRLQ